MATQAAGSRKKDTLEGGALGNGADTASLADKGAETVENVKETGKTLLNDAKVALSEKASTAVEDKKVAFTGGLTSVADSIRQMSGSLGTAEPNPLTEYSAKYADVAAEKVESVARYLEQADLKAVSRDVESFARRNPAVFIAAAFGVGILAARFIKSSAETGTGNTRKNGSGGRRSADVSTSGMSNVPSTTAVSDPTTPETNIGATPSAGSTF